MHFLPRAGMDQAQLLGVEHLTCKTSAEGLAKAGTVPSVERVTQERMSRGRHMHTNLMGATRFQLALNEGKGLPPLATDGIALQHGVVGDRLPHACGRRTRGKCRHFFAVARIATNGIGQRAAILLEVADTNGVIHAANGMGLELLGEREVRRIVFGKAA